MIEEIHAMTAPSSIDPARFLHERLASASPDLLRSMLTTFMNALMSTEADAICGAPYGQSSPERTNVRNGYRQRELDTRVGTLEVAIPKLREGSVGSAAGSWSKFSGLWPYRHGCSPTPASWLGSPAGET
jgi:hypothetical protein